MPKYKNPIPSLDEDSQARREIIYYNEYDYQKRVFFAFIDVLGFKKAFDDNREDSKVKDIEFAKKFREVFEYYFELMNASNLISDDKKTGCYAGQTSDSLYFYSPREDLLVEYIKIFLHFNLYAMSEDVFFRGGIAEGNLFIKDPYQFYGESVIYAYLLESVVSRYPIIVIDENTHEAIKHFPESDSIIKTQSGRFYLNIFAPLQSNFAIDLRDRSFEYRQVDESHILENIERNKKKFEYDPKNYEKYEFLLKEYKEYKGKRNISNTNE